MLRLLPMIITVQFPALTELVAYLREQDRTQHKLDALAAEIESLTSRLQNTNAELKAGEEANQPLVPTAG